MAQPHILCQVCGVYVSYECEAGLESLHIGVEIAFSGLVSSPDPTLKEGKGSGDFGQNPRLLRYRALRLAIQS